MPENKFSILCTSEMDISKNDFIHDNISIDVIPFIEKKILHNATLKNAVAEFLHEKITVIFTSKTAVSAVASMRESLPTWKIYCIENTTRNAVEDFFPGCAIAGKAANARELAKKIISNGESQVVFFSGNKRLGDLPGLLKNAGIQVKECIVYETNILDKNIQKNYDAIIFLSPSAVQGFFKNHVINSETVLFSMGEKTTEAIHNFSNNQIIIAQYPDKAQLLSEAISFLDPQIITH
ncbi:MAG: uroporphyrinogen-III synthase [Chitinophagaceae bacterium]